MPRPSDPHAKIKLLVAAEAEFVEKGLDRAKVEHITARAGLSKGAFYLHFQSKEDAFRQLVDTMIARMAQFVDCEDIEEAELEELFKRPQDFLEDWADRDLQTFDFLWQNRGLMRLVMAGGGGVEYRHLVDDFGDRAANKVADRLARGVRHGLYRPDIDIEVASLFLAGAYDRFARRVVRSAKKPELSKCLHQLRRMSIRALGTPQLIELAEADPQVTEPIKRKRRSANKVEAA